MPFHGVAVQKKNKIKKRFPFSLLLHKFVNKMTKQAPSFPLLCSLSAGEGDFHNAETQHKALCSCMGVG